MDSLRLLLSFVPFEARILRYLLAGGTSAVTNLALLFIFTNWLHIWYIYSSLAAVSVATVMSFVLQKLWTFRNYGLERVHIQFPLHVVLALVNIVLNTIFLYALVEWAHLWYLFAQIIVGALLACMNYAAYKMFIFAR